MSPSAFMNPQPLTIAVIAQLESGTLTTQLQPCALKRGHRIDRISMSHVSLSEFESDPQVQQLLDYDLVYYRTGLESVGAWVLEAYLRKHGKRMLNGVYLKHPFIIRKKYQVAIAAQAGLTVPKTVVHTADSYEQLVEALGTPFVAKADVSAQGRDVHLISSREEFDEIAPLRPAKKFLYQEYIEHSCDYRVHTLMHEPISLYRRVPASGDFRSNVSRGGHMESVDPARTAEVFAATRVAAAAFGLDIAGIDFLESTKDGTLYFSEINNNPGWDGELVGGGAVDVSEQVVTYFEEEAARQQGR